MSCNEIRRRVIATEGRGLARELRDHLDGCPACAAFAARFEAVRSGLGARHARVEPDAGFAGRVAARLHRDPAVELGWVALRILPATLALLGVLAWVAVQTAHTPSSLVDLSRDDGAGDSLAWALGEDEDFTP